MVTILSFFAVFLVAFYFLYMQYADFAKQSQNTSTSTDATQSPAEAPGQATDWIGVKNDQLGFSLKYPVDFFDAGHEPKIFAGNCSSQDCRAIGETVAGVLGVPPWQNPNGEKLNINNNSYLLCQSFDAAMGHYYTYYYYVAVKNDKCLVVAYDTTSINCDFYLPLELGNTEQEANYKNCVAKNEHQPGILQQIINTFQFVQ